MSLSSTTSLYFGEYAFASAPQFEVTDSSSLESIEFSAHAFETGADFSSMLNCMCFYGLSKIAQHLHSIEFRGYNLSLIHIYSTFTGFLVAPNPGFYTFRTVDVYKRQEFVYEGVT